MKEVIEDSGLTDVDFARSLGLPQGTVAGWTARNRTPDAEHLAKVVQRFGISGHWLLTGDGPKEGPGLSVTGPYVLGRATMSRYLRDRLRVAIEATLRAVEAQGEEELRAAQIVTSGASTAESIQQAQTVEDRGANQPPQPGPGPPKKEAGS